MDRLVVASMISSRGKAPVPGTNMAPVPIAINAPPPVLIVPPMPEAEPAKCGRTDIMPAVAFGRTIPLPRPIKQTHPKKDIGCASVKRNKLMLRTNPRQVKIVPISTIRLIPSVLEKRPDMPFPTI